MEVIRKHPNMVLREDNFSCVRINWQDKVSNLYEISKELNIGLDCKITDLSQSHIIRLLKLLERNNLLIETSLKKDVQANAKRLIEIKSHRGLKFVRKRGPSKR